MVTSLAVMFITYRGVVYAVIAVQELDCSLSGPRLGPRERP